MDRCRLLINEVIVKVKAHKLITLVRVGVQAEILLLLI